MNGRLSNLRRRDFLKLAAAGGLALSIPLVGSKLVPRLVGSNQNTPFTMSFNAIGTVVTIQIDDVITQDYANQLVGTVTNNINALGNVLTRFPGGTNLYNLNQIGTLEDPTSDILAVLEQATSYSESTGGSFDVTVKPVLDLLQGYLSGQPFPSDSQFNSALDLIDYESVGVSPNLVSLDKPGMGVTLDGIATGYILDKSIKILRSNGIKSAFVNFGGTLATIGSRSDGTPWQIGIVDPITPTNTIGTLYLKDQAVATSGDYEDYFTSNKDYYHIIDPFTARSPLFSHSATVVASTAMVADPLGVALMVENPSDAMNLIDSFPAECLLYTDSDGLMTSSGMKQLMTS
ncbi:MAG: FAD:protein FMN transferase [Nitrososphaerales archaeon]|jgi:thiamine biosynthesis lipoprotein